MNSVAEKPEAIQPQNWESHVVVPLVQNLAGGVATALLSVVATHAWNHANAMPTDAESLLRWGGIVGLATAAIATIVRFFGDDIGLMKAVYVAGQRSRDEEIQRLNRHISQLENKQQPVAAKQDATVANVRLARMSADYENAVKLFKMVLNGDLSGISRDSSKHGLGRRAWERAVSLLEKAKVYDHRDGNLFYENRAEALRALAEFYKEQYQLAKQNENFHPAWW